MPGPQATVTAHPDTYDTLNKPVMPTPASASGGNVYTKKINPTDAKVGPPSKATIHKDSFNE